MHINICIYIIICIYIYKYAQSFAENNGDVPHGTNEVTTILLVAEHQFCSNEHFRGHDYSADFWTSILFKWTLLGSRLFCWLLNINSVQMNTSGVTTILLVSEHQFCSKEHIHIATVGNTIKTVNSSMYEHFWGHDLFNKSLANTAREEVSFVRAVSQKHELKRTSNLHLNWSG